MEPASSGALVVSGGGLAAMGRASSIVVRGAAAAACLSISRGQVHLLAGRLAGELAPGGVGKPRRGAAPGSRAGKLSSRRSHAADR